MSVLEFCLYGLVSFSLWAEFGDYLFGSKFQALGYVAVLDQLTPVRSVKS